jgi:hypothetical protein
MVAAGMAAVLVVGSLARPATSALAWDPDPTAATDAQKTAAIEACQIPDAPVALGGDPEDRTSGSVSGPAASGLPEIVGRTEVVAGGGAVPSGGMVAIPEGAVEVSGGAVVTTDGAVPGMDIPELPTELPPLAYLELHGTGAVAIFADDTTTAYCLLVARGDGFELAGLSVPLGDGQGGIAMGAGVVVGLSGEGAGTGAVMSGMAMAGADGFDVAAMATDYGDAKVGIVAGEAPVGAATVRVEGGPADGATATVVDGRFALWAPKALDGPVTLVALDASGAEVARVELGAPPAGPPVVTELTP